MSADAADRHPHEPESYGVRLRIVTGRYRGTGVGRIAGSRATVDLGPSGGVVDVPADYVEEIDDDA